MQFQLFCFCKTPCLQRNFHGRLLSIRVFSADVHYGPDSVSPRMNTITSRDRFKPIRIGENLVVNYNIPQFIHISTHFTIIAEIRACSLANFYCQYADRHMNLKFMRPVSERELSSCLYSQFVKFSYV